MANSDYLEEYISAMETRDEPDSGDVFAQLQQKENDLILAAELGKALLEKNEALSMENERMAEDYSKHLEELEQEKHVLRRKMTTMESEYETQVLQLQSDLGTLKQEMEEEHHSGKDAAKQRSQIISEITEQNQRLTRQLRDAIKNEEQLNLQLQQMRSQQDLRRSSMNDHVSHMEIMRDEINILTDKRLELERRVQALLEEREQLNSQLDESAERVLLLERLSREQSGQLRQTQREVGELAATNTSLTDRLEVLSRHSSPSTAHTSLMNELDMSADEGISSGSHLQANEENLLNLDDEVECDEPLVPLTEAQELRELKREVLDVYMQMRTLTERSRSGRRNSVNSLDTTSSEDVPLHKVKAGLLQEVFKELQSRVHDLLRPRKGACETCGRDSQLQMEIDLHAVQEKYDQLDKRHTQQTDTLKRQAEELSRHMHQLTMKEKQYEALKEERDILKEDLNSTHMSKEELIKKAWEVRDKAVQRKNATEIELARARIDVMQINSQLLESIQQKVELSCQLDQWQSDMQQLLDEQMKKKLSQIEQASDSDSSTGATTPGRHKKSILGIFSRS
ncbi:bicaudal D-related protein homolog isoform X2 [Pollicipes pollicipes]|uniref:bicaudal D-related protein homolog isoform X2 n=1 Tax=Pollicipes pollicipes TaxID=41117 RepID=UPI001884BF8C|nr:bicaudal D-related protein homolog isoform X2 [Pollicipes pollicipes]